MTIREYTNRECDELRTTSPEIVSKRTMDEQEILDGLQEALCRFSGGVKVIPAGVTNEQIGGGMVTRNNMTREQLNERDRIMDERRKMMCKNGCGVLAKYRNLGICQRCYTAKLRAEKKDS